MDCPMTPRFKTSHTKTILKGSRTRATEAAEKVRSLGIEAKVDETHVTLSFDAFERLVQLVPCEQAVTSDSPS